MQKNVIIFDFDGTISNTLESIINIMNDISNEFGFKKIQKDDVEHLRGKKPREILKYLGISLFKLPFVIKRARKEINSHIATLSPSVDLLPVLNNLKENGCKFGIVTTNSHDNVMKFLYANNLSDSFDFVYSARKIFGKDKTISKIIKENNMERSDVYFVCDEVRDIHAGKKAKVKTIAVSWGYNTPKALLKENPDYIVYSPLEIEKIVLHTK